MLFDGKFLVQSNFIGKVYSYEIVNNISDFKAGDCIITKFLNPDLSLLINKIDLIITENGSSLSHLAIIARDYDKKILIVKDIINRIKKRGKLSLYVNNGDVKIEIKIIFHNSIVG